MTASPNSAAIENLFRRQAIAALSKVELGRPICQAPPSWNWLTLLLVAVFLSAAIITTQVSYDRTVTARGWLVPVNGVVTIASDRLAMAKTIFVTPGQSVVAGEALVLLSTDRRLSDGRLLSETDSNKIREELSQLGLQATLLDSQQQRQAQIFRAELEQSQAEQQAAELRIAGSARRVEIAKKKLQRIESAGDAIADWQRLQQRDELAALQSDHQLHRQQRIAIARERQRIESDLALLPERFAAELSVLRVRQSELERQLTNVDSSTVVTATKSGIIGDVFVQAGATVTPGESLLTLLDDESGLTAELMIPPRAAGPVTVGQSLRLELDAYPRQRYGELHATISSIADFVTMPSESSLALKQRDAAFRAHAELQSTALLLRPGMTFTASLVLDERRLIDWLLEPLYARRGS